MLRVLVMLTAHPGRLEALQAYEAAVIPILREHGAKLMAAFRPEPSVKAPDEIHWLEFPDLAALTAYRADPRVAALADQRAEAVAVSEMFVAAEDFDYDEEDAS